MTDARITKTSVEALLSGESDARITKTSVEALIRIEPYFKIVGDTLVAVGAVPVGVYPKTIRVTDAKPATLDKVFNLNITET